MKISRVFLKPAEIAKLALTCLNQEEREDLMKNLNQGDLSGVNSPVGYAYCDEDDGLGTSAFISTRRGSGEIFRTKKGDICLNIKVDSAQKKGDHEANTPKVSADAQPGAASSDLTDEQRAGLTGVL